MDFLFYLMLTESSQKNHPAPGQSADSDSGGGEFDHDEPPDGEGEGEPDGDCVDEDAEVHVEQQKVAPTCRKLQRKIIIINGIIYL